MPAFPYSFDTPDVPINWWFTNAGSNGWVATQQGSFGRINDTAANTMTALTVSQFSTAWPPIGIAPTTIAVGLTGTAAATTTLYSGRALPLLYPWHADAVFAAIFALSGPGPDATPIEVLRFVFKTVNLGTAKFKGIGIKKNSSSSNWDFQFTSAVTENANDDTLSWTTVPGWTVGTNFAPTYVTGGATTNIDLHLIAMWFSPDSARQPYAAQLDGHWIEIPDTISLTALTASGQARNTAQGQSLHVYIEGGTATEARGVDLHFLGIGGIESHRGAAEVVRALEGGGAPSG